MRRLAVHQSVGNLYEEVQRNDSAGVIPRITILVDCCMSIIYMTDTSKLRYVPGTLYRINVVLLFDLGGSGTVKLCYAVMGTCTL